MFRFQADFFLTARDCCKLSEVCAFTFTTLHTNVKYWKRAFQCLGNIPMYINPDVFDNDVVPIRRWSIVAMIKRRVEQRVHIYNTDVGLALKITDERKRADRLNQLKGEFIRKTHACPLCFEKVTFQYQLNSSVTKKDGFGSVFMACSECCAHQVWSHAQAQAIWGFTEGQLRELAHCTMSKVKFYCTADLKWLRERKYPYYTSRTPESYITPKQRDRLKDLPPVVAMNLKLRELTVDRQGAVWERVLNVATGMIVDQPMRPVHSLTAHGAVEVKEGAAKRLRPGVESSGPTTTLPSNIGDVGVVPKAGYLASGSNPSFVAYHGSEEVPVLASWVQHPVAKQGSYNARVFDPKDNGEDDDSD